LYLGKFLANLVILLLVEAVIFPVYALFFQASFAGSYLALVGVIVAAHLGMVFLHVAPPNVVSREYSSAINSYVRPEFQQNWKLFAPDPLHVSRDIEARAQVRRPDGHVSTSEWIDLTAADVEHVRHNLVPSHTRNQLRKGWRIFLGAHDDENRPINPTGPIIADYLKRVALMRMAPEVGEGAIEGIQLRAVTTRVADPPWSTRSSSTKPRTHVLPWWPVRASDFPEGVR
jgi:hypothetical protein